MIVNFFLLIFYVNGLFISLVHLKIRVLLTFFNPQILNAVYIMEILTLYILSCKYLFFSLPFIFQLCLCCLRIQNLKHFGNQIYQYLKISVSLLLDFELYQEKMSPQPSYKEFSLVWLPLLHLNLE